MKVSKIKRGVYSAIKPTFCYYAKLKFTFKQNVEWSDQYVYDWTWLDRWEQLDEVDKWSLGTIMSILDDGKRLLPMTSWTSEMKWNDDRASISVCWDGNQSMAQYKLLSVLRERMDVFDKLYVGPKSKFNIIDKVVIETYNCYDRLVDTSYLE